MHHMARGAEMPESVRRMLAEIRSADIATPPSGTEAVRRQIA
jgi:hypothetical protein